MNDVPAQLSKDSFREVIEHSPDGIAVHRDEKFLYVNPSFLRLFDVESADAIVGTSVYAFVHPEEHTDLRDRVRRMLTDAEAVPMRETRLLRSDGSQWVAELTARPVIFEGEPAIASIARDITERKQMTAQMMQMDRMIAAGTLAAGVGHELNNPLTYVAGNIEFALEGLAKIEAFFDACASPSIDEELATMREALSDAREGSARIRDIISQLRTFSPTKDAPRAALSVGRIFESVLGMVSNEIRHRAELVMELDEQARVYGSESKLGQVFLNLLINAAHAIEEGSRKDNEIRIRSKVVDSWVVIEVCDSGSGIPPEDLPRLFDPFFTTKPIGQGTGLGLYICQRIIKSHDGHIEIDSQLGQGTIVRVRLPRAQQTSPDSDEPSDVPS